MTVEVTIELILLENEGDRDVACRQFDSCLVECVRESLIVAGYLGPIPQRTREGSKRTDNCTIGADGRERRAELREQTA